jgi:hypothetical protein
MMLHVSLCILAEMYRRFGGAHDRDQVMIITHDSIQIYVNRVLRIKMQQGSDRC